MNKINFKNKFRSKQKEKVMVTLGGVVATGSDLERVF